jgi:hypothetical protein
MTVRRARSTSTRWAGLASAVLAAAVLLLPLASAAASEDLTPAPEPAVVAALPAELVVLLNGAPYDAEHGSRLDTCTLEIEMSGLAATEQAPVAVAVRISAIPPTVAEGASVLLVDDQQQAVGDTWAGSYPMADLLAVYEVKTNGYRLAIEVAVGGESLGEREVWLGCGADQTGHPNRILFEKVWLDEDGAPITSALDAVLPAGWRDDFAIVATSSRGTATCTYPEGSDELECTYDNPGHGDEPGLVVPNGKHHTYEVVEVGLPDGWAVDPATVGTFVGRETCDRGGGHDGGAHDAASAAETDAEEGGASTCTHEVVNLQQPVTPPAPPEPPAPPAPPAQPPKVLSEAGAQATLPATGAPVTDLAGLGVLLLVLGGLTTGAARVARRSPPSMT